MSDPIRFFLLLVMCLTLNACAAYQSPGGRVVFLVLVPAGLFAFLLYLLWRRRSDRKPGRGPRYPDYDDRD